MQSPELIHYNLKHKKDTSVFKLIINILSNMMNQIVIMINPALR